MHRSVTDLLDGEHHALEDSLDRVGHVGEVQVGVGGHGR